MRGVIANPHGELTPGLFAQMRLTGTGPYDALLVPDVAIGTEQSERFLLVVGPGQHGRPRARSSLGGFSAHLRAITDGLKAGESVIVDGPANRPPRQKVAPREAPIAPPPPEACAMSLAHFFIDRPVFAAVISIVTIIGGALAIVALPVAQYPEIAPPTVTVTTSYPGANAETVSNTVATPIEEQINGVEHMLYMSSQCTNDGAMRLTVTFQVGTNLDVAQVQVQNRVAIAQPQLPQEVQRQGIIIKKASPDINVVVALFSPDESHDTTFLSNYATLQVKDQIARLPGVGDINVFGVRDYAMRLWLDPDKLAARNMTAGDVLTAVREQNVQVAAGMIGGPPLPAGATQDQPNQ